MHDWNYSPDHPITLPLAADYRLGKTDYANDQIWELNLGNSEPPAITLQTTFGLRARYCRIFPRFICDGKLVNNPSEFHTPITIRRYFPNYLKLTFKPFPGINVEIEYWVPSSQAVAARTKIVNNSHDESQIRIEWAGVLVPAPDGNRMSTREMGLTTVLAGETSNLCPLLLISGNAQTGKSPYPSLTASFSIPPDGEQVTNWVLASQGNFSDSFNLAKILLAKNWDIEFGRIFRINSRRIEVITGDQGWNTAFYLSQTIADQLFLQPTDLCPSPSFVSQRNTEQGYSLLKDGSDYGLLWNGQSVLESHFITSFLLPQSPDVVKGILENFLATQTPQGEVDCKPGLGGQRSQIQATPLLASVAWQIYESTGDIEFLRGTMQRLLAFFFSWFSDIHDRDKDMIPEWDQITQTGFEEHPLFKDHDQFTGGMDISTVESPDLCSFLYQECQVLMSMANLIGKKDVLKQLIVISEKLREAVEMAWSDSLACYLYRDRDTHLSSGSQLLGKLTGSGVIDLHTEFTDLIRPVIYLKSKKEGTRPIQIYIHGTSAAGAHRIDNVPAYQIHWHLNTGYFTSDIVYKTLEKIEINGILPEDEALACTPPLTLIDHSLLLPLWAGITSKDKVKILINLTIMNQRKFLSPFGLRAFCSDQDEDLPREKPPLLSFPRLNLLLEGMLRYGEHKNAAEIFARTMNAVVQSLSVDMAFHSNIHGETGKPAGGKNSLASLVPIGLFLHLLGLKIIPPAKVEITGSNPFPWPVIIKYQGLTIVHQEQNTQILYTNGQNITVENDHPQIVNMNTPNQGR